uniref:Star n=1 Tax=Tribolium castaneum TaxID=7070 RepID=D8X0C4_TRICA|nr:star [Tribolium castaneum]
MYKLIMKFKNYFTKSKGPGQTPPPPQSSSPEVPATPAKGPSMTAPPTPNIIRKILPLAAFSVAFAIVMTVLILYMDNTAMRHYQFRVNMSQDYELLSVSQDNPQLITYIREVHMQPAIEPHHKPLESQATGPPEDTAYVLKLLNNKRDGVFVESGAYSDGKTSKTEWLEKKLGWRGLLIQSDTRHYFSLRRHNRVRSQAIHACLSSMPYPKEVTFHQENEVKINSVVDDPDWFTTRIKCFPLFSLLLAMNVTTIDYLSLESAGTELQVLETIPFERVKIEVIGVHLLASEAERDTIKKFLAMKQYAFMQGFNHTYIFMMNRVKI